MKYTIEGLSQKFLSENNLDCTDAVLIRYIIDFYNTDKMAKINVDGVEYFWLKYEYVIEQLPILGIKSKDGLYRRMKKYVECGIMKHYTKRAGGTYSCYLFNKETLTLLLGSKPDTSDEKSEGYGSKVGGGTDEKSEQKTLLSKETLPPEKDISSLPAEAVGITDSLIKHVRSLNPRAKNVTTGIKKTRMNWAGDIEKIHRIDKRSYDEIDGILRWVIEDDFWFQQILSGSKLREKFDTLVIKAGSKVAPTGVWKTNGKSMDGSELCDNLTMSQHIEKYGSLTGGRT